MLIWQARQPRSVIWKRSSFTWVIMEHQLLVSLFGKEREGPEEEVSKIGTTDKKEKEKIQTYMKTRVRLFLSLLTCSHQLVGKAFTSLLILLCRRWNKYFSNIIFQQGLRLTSLPHFADFSSVQYRSWREIWVLAYIACIAKMMQTVLLFSIKGGYSSLLFLDSTALTVLLPSSSTTQSYRQYNTIFNFHLPQVGLSFKTKFLSAGL